MTECAFCRPGIGAAALWEGEQYLILADEFPRCPGHLLLISRGHLGAHVDAPPEWREEFREAQELIRRFLLQAFGRASFFENGGRRQKVPHAHLHGFPFRAEVRPKWLERGRLRAVSGWESAREERQQAGAYYYLETESGSYLLDSYGFMLERIRRQLVEQTPAERRPRSGALVRGGPEMVEQTRALWREAGFPSVPGRAAGTGA